MDGLNGSLHKAEHKIGKSEDASVENIQTEAHKENKSRKKGKKMKGTQGINSTTYL